MGIPARPIAALLVLAGCLQSNEVVCGFGTCASDKRCDEAHMTCVFPDQISSCVDKDDKADCTFGTLDGVCSAGVCVERSCGDKLIDGAEVCEPSLGPPPQTCVDLAYDSGIVACSDECTTDTSGCRQFGFVSAGALAITTVHLAQVSADVTYVAGSDGADHGVIYRQEGYAHTLVETADHPFASISASSPTNVWAVGDDDLFHFDGTGWTDQSISGAAEFSAIATVSDTEAYVTTSNGGVYKFDGATWTLLRSDSDTTYIGAFSNGGDLWLVGAKQSSGNQALVRRWDGSTWTDQAFPPLMFLRGVWGSSASDMYVVGDSNSAFHFNGTAWSPLTLVSFTTGVPPQLHSVSGSGPDNVLIAGGGQVFHFDGVGFSSLDTTETLGVDQVSVFDRDHAIVSGGLTSTRLFTLSGTARSVPAALSVPVPHLEGVGRNAIYAAGSDLWRFDGTYWQHLSSATTDRVAVQASGELVAGSYAGLQRYADNLPFGPIVPLPGVDMGVTVVGLSVVSPTEMWVVTDVNSGGIYKSNGTTATMVHSLGDDGVDLYAPGSNNVYVASTSGIFHFDGTAWTQVFMDPDFHIARIFGLSATDIYVLDGPGVLVHFDGTAWERRPIPLVAAPTAIAGTADNDLWLGGEDGLWRYDGTRWSPVRVPFSQVVGLFVDAHDVIVTGPTQATEHIIRACATCL